MLKHAMLGFVLPVLVALAVVAAGGTSAVAGDDKMLGPDAVLLTGDALSAALDDTTAEGWSFDGDSWFYFVEHYGSDGTIEGSGGPAAGSTAWQWSGNWRTEPEQACFDYPALGSGACRSIYLENGVYKNVADGEVRAHWQPMN